VAVDNFSRYVILALLSDKLASFVARVLIDHVINPFTTPKVILSDNGGEFRNQLIAELCTAFNIQQTFIVAHHPSSNGLVERANRKILEALRHVTNRFSQTWDTFLSHIAASINSSYNASISESPHFVLFGVDKRLPYDILLNKPEPVYNPDNYAKVQLSAFQRIHQAVRDHLSSSNSQAKLRQHRNARSIKFDVGDIVFLLNFMRDSKLAPKHLGPFRVLEKHGNKCVIRDLATHTESTVHASNLRKIPLPSPQDISAHIPSSLPPSPPDPPTIQQIFPTPPPHPYPTRSKTRKHLVRIR